MGTPRMMPGQEPYTEEEWARVKGLVHDAAAGDPGERAEGSHWIHSDSPTGTESTRPGRRCGPHCDLYEDPG